MILPVVKENYSVDYGQNTINFGLIYTDRKTMAIEVLPNGKITVKAPISSEFKKIEQKVRKRGRWILKQRNYFKQFEPRTPKRAYVSGETHLYFGKKYRLKIKHSQLNMVKLSRGFLNVYCPEGSDAAAVKKLLENWFREKAAVHYNRIFSECWVKFEKSSFQKPNLSIKVMKTRWGSLSNKGTLSLSLNLIKTPRECIEYVIIHELCHLKYHDHGSSFYKLLDSKLPGWERVKGRLENVLV